VNSVSLTGSTDFKLLNTLAPNTSVAVGQQVTFNIQYTPSDAGGDQAILTVVTNAKDSSTQVVSLNGSGLAPLVQYSFAPYNGITYPYNSMFHHVALRFGDTLTQYMYITNTGLAPLVVNSITPYGLQGNMYQVSRFPKNPIQPGVTDSIGIRFQPFLEGRTDAALAISTNAFNQANDTVTFWGVGKLAHLVVTPQSGMTGSGTITGSLTFDSTAIGDSICRTLVLHNTGTDTLFINRQQITYGDYDFHFYLLSKSDTMLVPDASKLVNVCFVPIAPGARFASLRFYTSIPKTYPDQRDTSQFLIQVTGTGVPFGKLAVSGPAQDSAILGDTKCITDTIWNTGTSDLTVNSVKLSGPNAADFTLGTLTLPLVLAKGTFQTVQLCFKPSVRGLENASITVNGTSSGRAQTMALPILGVGQQVCMDATPNPVMFGSTALPTMTLAKTGHDTAHVHVSNCGDVSETFTPSFSTGTSANYKILTNTLTLAPQGNGTIDVEYSPDTLGTSTGSVVVTSNIGSVTPITLPLAGQGAGVLASATGQPKYTMIGTSSTFTLTLTNNGNVPWTPGAATVTGAGYSVAAGATTQPATIPVGQTGTIDITFTPTTSGAHAGTLTFANTVGPTPLDNTQYNFSAQAGTSTVAMRSQQDGFVLGTSYPNPAKTSAVVAVTMPYSAKVNVRVVGIDGADVASVYSGVLPAGEQSLTFDVSTLASCTYFYILESGNVRLVREMVVAK